MYLLVLQLLSPLPLQALLVHLTLLAAQVRGVDYNITYQASLFSVSQKIFIFSLHHNLLLIWLTTYKITKLSPSHGTIKLGSAVFINTYIQQGNRVPTI